MSSIQAYEKKQKLVYFFILLISVVAAGMSKLINLGLDEYVNIPVAKLMNKVSGEKNHELYFLVMYFSFPFMAISIIKNNKMLLRRRDKAQSNKKATAFIVLIIAMSFVSYVCYFASPMYKIGGGRFSLIISLVSTNWIALGITYGLLFASGSMLLSMLITLISSINKDM